MTTRDKLNHSQRDQRAGLGNARDDAASLRQAFIRAQQRMLALYRVDARSRYIEVPALDGHAHVLVSGDGPAVVLINGIGSPGAMWAPLMARLEGLRLYVVDLPTYGLTDYHPGLTDALRRNAVGFLESVLDGLGLERPAVLASSMGSLWANWLALERPDRVAALVHVGCPALVLDTTAPLPFRLLSIRPLGRLMTWLQPPSPKTVEQMSKVLGEYPMVPELVDLLVATERMPGYRQTFLDTLHALVGLRGARPGMGLTAEQLAAIRQPTLVVWGRHDPFGPPSVGERMVVTQPDAQLQRVEGGHVPWLTQADRIGPNASRFLQCHARDTAGL